MYLYKYGNNIWYTNLGKFYPLYIYWIDHKYLAYKKGELIASNTQLFDLLKKIQ